MPDQRLPDQRLPDPRLSRTRFLRPGRLRLAVAALSVATVGAIAPLAATPASAWTTYSTDLIVRATDSGGGQFAGGTGSAELSEDGNWLAFSRLSTNGSFVKSLVSGKTELISVNDAEQPANAPSTVEGVSGDGELILFATAATNMGKGPATARDLYVRVVDEGTTYRANYIPGSPSQVPAAVKAGESVLSDDGHYVSYATTTNHVYARNVTSSYLTQVDVSSAEVPGNGGSGQPSVSETGRYVTFTSSSSDLVAGDSNFAADVFQRDIQTGTTVRVSLSETEGAPNLGSGDSSVSKDGSSVAFTSTATNLVAGDTNGSQDVFVRYLPTGTTLRASLGVGTTQANGDSSHPDISSDGTRVAFDSTASNLDTGTNNNKVDVFVREISGNLTVQKGKDGSTGPNLGAANPSLSAADGAVAFTSASSNLVGSDTNGAGDVFVQRLEPNGPYLYSNDLTAGLQTAFGSDGGYAAPELDIADGRLTTGHFIISLARHPAWAKDRAPVARLYQAFFHREPDLGGLTFWIKKRAGGTKLSVIAASFAASNEFTTTYGTVNASAFVELVYNNVLQRWSDPAGLEHWVAKLAGGMSRGDVMVAFSESSEGQRKLSPEVDATLMGLAMLKKMPPNALWLATAAAARDHRMPEWGAITILNSQAYSDVVSK
jgi:hypothetical protein